MQYATTPGAGGTYIYTHVRTDGRASCTRVTRKGHLLLQACLVTPWQGQAQLVRAHAALLTASRKWGQEPDRRPCALQRAESCARCVRCARCVCATQSSLGLKQQRVLRRRALAVVAVVYICACHAAVMQDGPQKVTAARTHEPSVALLQQFKLRYIPDQTCTKHQFWASFGRHDCSLRQGGKRGILGMCCVWAGT